MPDGCSERSKLNSKEQNGRSGESRAVISGMTRGGEFYWHLSQVIVQMHSSFHFTQRYNWIKLNNRLFLILNTMNKIRTKLDAYMQIQIWFPLLSISFWIIKAQNKAVQKKKTTSWKRDHFSLILLPVMRGGASWLRAQASTTSPTFTSQSSLVFLN